MKRASMILVMLVVANFGFAQQSYPAPSPSAGQPSSSQTGGASSKAAQSSTGQSNGAQSNSAQTNPTAGAQPQGKRPPQAKTQPEFEAYQAAIKTTDATALEKAATDFATKFPDSELKLLLFRATMRAYQMANNAEKMQEVGNKVLSLDPNDPEALIGVAEITAEHTRDSDIDKDQRLADASKMAQHALETIDTDISVPAGTPQEKIDAYKNGLRSSAYSIIGTLQFNQGKFSDAEGSFHKSIDAFPSQPDPVVVLRLALALDKQNKYPEALTEANKAVQLTQEGTNAGMVARKERDRLVQLTGGSVPPSAPGGAAAGGPTSAAPSSGSPASSATTPPKK
ncbi:MAG: hypothetical protein M3O09_02260 [Acidobacteriota bacterium]|nr:hypothetical protein [Acidobacteriota bacterium]